MRQAIFVALLWIGAARAQDVDPLLAAGSADPVVLGRVLDRIGDDAVLARLAGEATPSHVRLAAIHAAPAMRGPERALEALAVIAIGRDPDLAPAAARSLLAIAIALDPRALDAREVMPSELTPARARIDRLAADASARPDIRRAAAIAAEILGHLGVPPAEG